MAKAYQAPELAGMFSSYQVNVPQLYADVDRTQGAPARRAADRRLRDACRSTSAPCTSTTSTGSAAPTGARAGRRAVPRARRGHRPAEDALEHGRDGAALGADERAPVGRTRARDALQRLPRGRHQRRRRRPAISSGQAQAAIERIAAETLPPGISYEWTELTYQQILAGNTAIWVFPLACCWCSWCSPRSTRAGAAARDHPDRADVPARRADRRLAHARRQQHLHADRLHGAGGLAARTRS